MKKLTCLIVLLVAGLMVVQTGCNKDDDKKPTGIKLVVVKRSTGALYTVDKTTGDLTEIGSLTIDGKPLSGLRGLVYDPDTELCYGGGTNDGGKGFYSINITTGVATLLNSDAGDDWDGIADLILSTDGNILANLYSNIEDGSSLVVFNKLTGEDGTHNEITDGESEGWSPGGLTYGASATQVILGGGEMNIYFANTTGLVSDTIALIPTVNIDDADTYIMDLETDADGTVFAMLYEYYDETQYLVKLNINTGEITEMSVLTTSGISNGYHCLAFIPASKLP